MIVFKRPFDKETGKKFLILQHCACTMQVIVVVGYWGILFPKLGWGKQAEGPYREFMIFLMVHKHVTPFLCKENQKILVEFY